MLTQDTEVNKYLIALNMFVKVSVKADYCIGSVCFVFTQKQRINAFEQKSPPFDCFFFLSKEIFIKYAYVIYIVLILHTVLQVYLFTTCSNLFTASKLS